MTSSDLESAATFQPAAPTAPGAQPSVRRAPATANRASSVPDVVAAVTGAVPVVTTVVAVVVTRGVTPYLARTLAAVRAQSTAPDSVVVVDAGSEGTRPRRGDVPLGDARFVSAPRSRSFGEAVGVALAAEPDGVPSPWSQGTWLWLLHDDSAPAPDALEHQLRAVEHSSAVAIAGAKQELWEAGRGAEPADPFEPGAAGRLVEVGYTTTPLGRRMTGIDDDEIDQGQHDAREDVLAVGLAGALVRRSVWDELGGPDPELGPFGDGLDLARRARLAGHRVVVVPAAVVRHVQASLLGLREHPDARPDPDTSYAPRRRAHLHARLTGVAALLVPVVALAMLVCAPFHAAYRLLVKQPGQARDELLAPLWALLRVGPVVRARRAARRTRRLPRSTLRPLRGTWRQVLAERRDRRLARAEQRRTAWAPTDIERTELRTLATHRRAALGGVALALVTLTAVVFGPLLGTLLGDGRLVGGELLPATSTLGDVWRAATTGWVESGLGAPAPADPFVFALLPATLLVGGSAQTAVNVLVPLCLLAAGLGAWFAAGALTRSVPLRVWATLVWVAAPVLLSGVAEGRAGSVLVHAALPWTALAVTRALGLQRLDTVAPPTPDAPARPHRQEPGSLAAAAAAGLLLAVVVAGAPVLIGPAVLALGVVAVGARRHRRYLALVPVPALVVFAPFLVHVVRTWADGGWRLLLADPGAPVASSAGPAWQQLLGLPADPGAWFGLDGGGTVDLLAHWAPFVAGASVVVLAVVGALRGRGAAVGAWFVAALGLAVAVLAGATTVAAGETVDAPVTGWSGPGISVMLLALLGAALLGTPRLPGGGAPAWRTGLVVALAVVVTVLPLGGLASWTAGVLDRHGASVGDVRATDTSVVPPVGRQIQDSPRQARVLSLEPGDGTTVSYALLRSDGPQAVDSSVVVHGIQAGDPGALQGDVPRSVAELVSGTSDDVAGQLADAGVGAVLVPASVPSDGVRSALVARLDMTAGLERMTEGQDSLIWRVSADGQEASWARVVTPDDASALPLDADRDAVRAVDTRVGAGSADRVLQLAENASPGWRATLGGRDLEALDPATTDGVQAFRLGPDGGRLEVFHATDHRSPWLTVGGIVLVVYVLLAVPVRRRRAGVR